MASDAVPSDPQETLEQDLLEFLETSHKMVVLTGAGASTESGIPDFRSPDGIWRRYPPSTYQDFISKPEARKRYWELRRVLVKQVTEAKPNATHFALAELERMGKLSGIITQNFDGLHQDAGNAPEHVIELHGTSRAAACTLCGERSPISALVERVEAGDEDPRCERCGGYLKAATILFGQPLPRAELEQAIALAQTCDLFLVIGSSLRVSPASRLPMLAVERGMPLVIINREPTPLDPRADLVLHASAGQTMARLMARLRKKEQSA
ncbi:MAG TPA: Sir2 family NAD-dependent protein deacetylase [Ktedonobacterales bacterium]|nr:Sir2 family NAD-dependent protein deacetylase [Ktedonobacterales bacterium]